MGLALLAAAGVLFGAVPVGVIAFVLRADEVSSAWAEGGWPMIATLAVAMLCALGAAVLVGIAARASAKAAVLLPGAVVLPALVGVLGTMQGMNGARAAIAHAMAADRGTIMAAALGEAFWSTAFGGFMSGGLALTCAVALLVAALARKSDAAPTSRHALSFGAGISLCAAAVAFVGALSTRAVADAYSALGHLAPADLDAVEKFAPNPSWALASLVVMALAVLAVVASALAFRTAPTVATALGVSCLVGIAVLGASTRGRVSAEDNELIANRAWSELLFFNGGLSDFFVDVTVIGAPPEEDSDLMPAGYAVEQAVSMRRSEEEPVQLGLARGVSANVLADALNAAAARNAGALLLVTTSVQGEQKKRSNPFEKQPSTSRGVEVLVGTRHDLCANCTFAKLSPDALEVDGERWPLATSGDVKPGALGKPIFLMIEPREPLLVLRAGLTAMQHGRRLAFIGELPEAETQDSEELVPPRVDVSLTSTGPVSLKMVKSVFAQRQRELGECFLTAALPFTARAQFTIDSQGAVGAFDFLDAPDDFSDSPCVAQQVGSWDFEAPAQRGVSVVTVKFNVQAAE